MPDDAAVEAWDLLLPGRAEPTASCRRIPLHGQVRHGEVRVRRGGLAVLAAMCTPEYVAGARAANHKGTVPTVADPANAPPGTPRT